MIQELYAARSSFEQTRFNLVGALHLLKTGASIHCHHMVVRKLKLPILCISRSLPFLMWRRKRDLNFWRLLVGQWMLISAILNKYFCPTYLL